MYSQVSAEDDHCEALGHTLAKSSPATSLLNSSCSSPLCPTANVPLMSPDIDVSANSATKAKSIARVDHRTTDISEGAVRDLPPPKKISGGCFAILRILTFLSSLSDSIRFPHLGLVIFSY